MEPAAVEKWICELCQNEETLEASLVFYIFVPEYIMIDDVDIEF